MRQGFVLPIVVAMAAGCAASSLEEPLPEPEPASVRPETRSEAPIVVRESEGLDTQGYAFRYCARPSGEVPGVILWVGIPAERTVSTNGGAIYVWFDGELAARLLIGDGANTETEAGYHRQYGIRKVHQDALPNRVVPVHVAPGLLSGEGPSFSEGILVGEFDPASIPEACDFGRRTD